MALDDEAVQAFADLYVSKLRLTDRHRVGAAARTKAERVGRDQLREQALELRPRQTVPGAVQQLALAPAGGAPGDPRPGCRRLRIIPSAHC